ncbi:MAG: hypothetical protein GX130_13330 [Candidatus Hydrogenedens sp.]|jgi:hypothetical protein|nr:hypothetical protein [Candidatus Hydrogenedens sp.]
MTDVLTKDEEAALLCPEGFLRSRIRGGTAWMRADVNAEQLQQMMGHEQEVLKETDKSKVSRLGHWIIKRRKTSGGRTALASLARRNMLRMPWYANHYLRQRGVPVPEPLAYVEFGYGGVVTSTASLFQYLNQCRDVEHYLFEFIRQGADVEAISSFLFNLARAFNTLEKSGAWHGDLSGKNIYTGDGKRFYFIDLEAVELKVPYTEERRMKNHVQLYDSFCDALTDTLLFPFIKEMTPESIDLRVWMPEVRRIQEERRTAVEQRWEKYGAPEKINPLRALRRNH